ncbi:MAG: DUF393 domain-containing protein [Caryophanon sp.]|nr:DUF393 domain-containing protein [Caryophanon sp.]
MKNNGVLVLYDGQCGLCDGVVQFLLAHDVHNRFYFAALDSETGQVYKKRYRIDDRVDSVIVIERERAYMYSDAVVQLAKHLPMPYAIGYIARIVPAVMRDALYKQVAKRRLAMFGTVNACQLPTMAQRQKFLS